MERCVRCGRAVSEARCWDANALAYRPDHLIAVPVWNGQLDVERQRQAAVGVKPKRRCTFSLVGDTGHQGSSHQQMAEAAAGKRADEAAEDAAGERRAVAGNVEGAR